MLILGAPGQDLLTLRAKETGAGIPVDHTWGAWSVQGGIEPNHGHLSAILLKECSSEFVKIKLQSLDLGGSDKGLSQIVGKHVCHAGLAQTESLESSSLHEKVGKLTEAIHTVDIVLAEVDLFEGGQSFQAGDDLCD